MSRDSFTVHKVQHTNLASNSADLSSSSLRESYNESRDSAGGSQSNDRSVSRSYRKEESFSVEQREDSNFYPYLFDRDPVTKILNMMGTDNIDSVFGYRKRPTQALIFDHVIAVLMNQFADPPEFPKPEHYREYEVCLKFLRKIKNSENEYTPEIAKLISDHEVKLFELYSQIDVNDVDLDMDNLTILDGPLPQSIIIEDMLNIKPTVHNCYVNNSADEDRVLLQQINSTNKEQSQPTPSTINASQQQKQDLDDSIGALFDAPDAHSTGNAKKAIAQKGEPRLSGLQPGDLMRNVGTFRTILRTWQNQIVSRIEEDKRQLETMAKLIASLAEDYK